MKRLYSNLPTLIGTGFMNNTALKILAGAVAWALMINSVPAWSRNIEDKKPLPVHYGGRVVIGNLDNVPTYTYSWPGVYFEAAFAGTEVDLRFNDGNNILNVIIDGQAPIVLAKPGKQTYSIRNLTDGKHHIRVEKRTETQFGTGTFEGFFIPGNAQAIAVEKPKRSIEFIGDSAVVGYGIRSLKRECSEEEIFSLTDTQLSYAALTAKALKADYQINALSGFGVVRNYNGGTPGQTFLTFYPYALHDKSVRYQGNGSPNIMVIGLGGNDFATPLNPSEQWKKREALQSDYVESYAGLVLSLRKKHPQAHLILLSYDPVNKELDNQIARVMEKLKMKGEGKISLLGLKPAVRSACQWHPSEADHRNAAETLINHIEANPGLWN